jgi:HAD superfamily hydrolase (TIGR01484 family)
MKRAPQRLPRKSAAPERLREHAAGIARALLEAEPGVVALDYDGTLTEIVPEPEEARLTPERRELLGRLARIPSLRVAILSGRALRDAAARIGVAGVTVVGNHGLEIEGLRLPQVERSRPVLERFLAALESDGELPLPVHLEDKVATATVHLRGTRAERDRDRLLAALQERLTRFAAPGIAPGAPGANRGASSGQAEPTAAAPLRLSPGKASVEVRPAVDWDKARALLHLLERWGAAREDTLYAGDDETDECVFAELREGVTVVIGEERAGGGGRAAGEERAASGGRTAGGGGLGARYVAADPAELYGLLQEIVRQSERRSSR